MATAKVVDSKVGGGHYALVQGVQGASRLEVLTRLSWSSSQAFLKSQGVKEGMHCLEAGCGAGAVSRLLKELLGTSGTLTGFDMDAESIEMAARLFADEVGATFKVLNIEQDEFVDDQQYDVIYCRFFLEHLKDPFRCIRLLSKKLKPGGLFIAQDIDCGGLFCWPENAAYQRNAELLAQLINVRGGQPDFGRCLPGMLKKAGYLHVNIRVENLAFLDGEGKQFMPLTLEALRKGLLEEELISKSDYMTLLYDLREFCNGQ